MGKIFTDPEFKNNSMCLLKTAKYKKHLLNFLNLHFGLADLFSTALGTRIQKLFKKFFV